jgi:hypothetical protein
METFTVSEKLTLREYLAANLFVAARMKMIRKIILFGFIIGLLNASLDLTSPANNNENLLFIILKFLFVPLFLFLFFSIGIILLCVLIYKFKPLVFQGASYRFNHWGMEKSGDTLNLSAPWSQFKKHQENSAFLFLYTTETNAYIIQKRMFCNVDELDAFKAFIRDKIQNN